MPFYEYQCSACRYYAEVMQKISDKPLKKCPSCGKNTFTKLISAPVFRLKGSGWYETDFKSDQEKKRNLAGAERDDAGTASKPASASAGKAEEKSDTKADTKAAAPDAGGDTKPAAGAAAKPAQTASSARTRGKTARKTAARKPARRAAKPAAKPRGRR